jgi:putative membrane protein
MTKWRYPLALLSVYAVIWIALAIDPVYRHDWLLENVLVLVAVPLLVWTARRLRFSDFTYTCLFVFFVFH